MQRRVSLCRESCHSLFKFGGDFFQLFFAHCAVLRLVLVLRYQLRGFVQELCAEAGILLIQLAERSFQILLRCLQLGELEQEASIFALLLAGLFLQLRHSP